MISCLHRDADREAVYAAVEITVEGGVFHISRRIRHLASLAVADEAAAREALLAERGLEGATGARP